MPSFPTALTATTRLFAPGVTKIYYVPTIVAATLVPTRAELTAGKDLSSEIADLSGWVVSAGTIDTPDLGSLFSSQIGGRTSASASSITFHADRLGVDVRTVLPRGTVGYILIADGGDVATRPADVFPVAVTSVGKVRSVSDKNLQLTISFAITRQPAEDIALPVNP